ncbi:thymidine kinase [Escherichia coli]|nr:thymidine kinase [Escherichia coli]EFL4883698.1 thymidine kinase [Escherichia coli]MED6699482.1 thymidine kinase [Escherichia coli O157]USL83597.1 thymidine kinase [Escherichia phage A4]HCQ0858509.1 thymidine kinase [Escherichia coli]
MGKLIFFSGSMSSGKSTHLLQNAYNHKKNGMKVIYLTSALDDRYGTGKITSRIGIESEAQVIPKDDLSVIHDVIKLLQVDNDYNSIYVDECQFLNRKQIDLLADIADEHMVDVYCYGIKTDFESNTFEGSQRLFEIADEIHELKNVCENQKCGRNAIMNARIVDSTDKVFIGGDESYKSLCRKCYKNYMRNKNG